MNGKHVENSEEEGHEVEGEDYPGGIEALGANGDWDEAENHSGDECDDCYDIQDVPDVVYVVVQLPPNFSSIIHCHLKHKDITDEDRLSTASDLSNSSAAPFPSTSAVQRCNINALLL